MSASNVKYWSRSVVMDIISFSMNVLTNRHVLITVCGTLPFHILLTVLCYVQLAAPAGGTMTVELRGNETYT
jgi:hypothetical protein